MKGKESEYSCVSGGGWANKRTEIEFFYPVVHSQRGLGQAQTKSWEFSVDLLCGLQGPKTWGHHLLPPMVYTGRKLDSEAEPGLQPWCSDTSWAHPKGSFAQCSPPCISFSYYSFSCAFCEDPLSVHGFQLFFTPKTWTFNSIFVKVSKSAGISLSGSEVLASPITPLTFLPLAVLEVRRDLVG